MKPTRSDQRVPGDNSMLILLYSVLTLAVTAIFLYVWFLNLKSTVKLLHLREEGKPVPAFREEGKTLLDERFHVTLLGCAHDDAASFYCAAHRLYGADRLYQLRRQSSAPGKAVHVDGADQCNGYFPWQCHQDPHLLPHSRRGPWSGRCWPPSPTTFWVCCWPWSSITGPCRLKKLWRTLFIISIAIPQFVSLLLISRALEPQGAVNVALMELGWIDVASAVFAGSDAGARLRGGHQYVDRHPLHHDDLQRRSDEYPLRPVRKRRDRRCGAGAQVSSASRCPI